MKKNTPKINQGYDNMDDLISRMAAIEACIEVSKQEEEHSKMWATGLRYVKRILTEAPSVPAVPLDKLCEWLQSNARYKQDGKIRADQWNYVLTKWMENTREEVNTIYEKEYT